MTILTRSRETPLWISGLALVLIAAWLFALGWLFPLFRHLQSNSLGLLNVTFLNYLLIFLIMGLLLIGVAHLRPPALGLRLRDLPTGFVLTALLWLLLQLIALILNLVVFGRPRLDSAWQQPAGATTLAGALILGQLLGNALFEETFWRAFLLPQCYFKLQRLEQRPRLRLTLALLISQGLFALYHIPIELSSGTGWLFLPLPLALIFAIGVLLALVYLRTGNLLLAVGLHALNDAPTVLFASTVVGNSILGNCMALLGAVLLIIGGPALRRIQAGEAAPSR
jgi:membrane protease YdiL (CAAX protease family)